METIHINPTHHLAPQDLLKDRVILITGAGSGLGRVAAKTFAAHGATVILHGKSVPQLELTYDHIVAAGGPQPAIFPLDLETASDKEFEAMANGIQLQLKRLDGILHNAARLDSLTLLADQTSAQWVRFMRINLIAPFAITRACLPLLKQAPDASIVMTSETHGHKPAAYWGGFAVSKAGLETLTDIWAQELALHPNLRINALVPGPVASPQRTATHPGEVREQLPSMESLMPAYLYLLGEASRGVSGKVFELAP